MDNLKIKSLTLQNYSCFGNVILDFRSSSNKDTAQWTVLMGNNNTGKTCILKAIAELTPTLFKTPNNEGKKKLVPGFFYDRSFYGMLKDGGNVKAMFTNDQEWFYSNNVVSVVDVNDVNPLNKTLLIFGYGVSRYPSSTSLSENKVKPCDTLFSSDSRLVNLEEWLMQLDYASKNDKTTANNRLYRIKEIICGNIFPEIQDFNFESSDELHNYVLFKTKDGDFRYTQLGYGYQSMLAWIVDLCKRLFDAYPDSENPLHGEAIVLIDEIDLHLHPKWQRDILPYLSKAFPNIQFIVTTHSPLVIQSMTDINLYILKRDEEGNVHVSRSPKPNYSGWTVEEILRDTMGLDSEIHSNNYNELLEEFNEALAQHDKEKVDQTYIKLNAILHPTNPIRKMLEIQRDLI